eukprot:284814743_6
MGQLPCGESGVRMGLCGDSVLKHNEKTKFTNMQFVSRIEISKRTRDGKRVAVVSDNWQRQYSDLHSVGSVPRRNNSPCIQSFCFKSVPICLSFFLRTGCQSLKVLPFFLVDSHWSLARTSGHCRQGQVVIAFTLKDFLTLLPNPLLINYLNIFRPSYTVNRSIPGVSFNNSQIKLLASVTFTGQTAKCKGLTVNSHRTANSPFTCNQVQTKEILCFTFVKQFLHVCSPLTTNRHLASQAFLPRCQPITQLNYASESANSYSGV